MRPWDFMPDHYRPPVGGDLYRAVWRADLGPGTAAGVVAEYVDAFQSVLELGEQWGD